MTISQSNGNKSKDKWNLIKLKSFWTMKETINKLKRQPSAWEEIITNDANDKALTSKIYISSCDSVIKRQTTQSKSGQKNYIDISPKKTYRWPIST